MGITPDRKIVTQGWERWQEERRVGEWDYLREALSSSAIRRRTSIYGIYLYPRALRPIPGLLRALSSLTRITQSTFALREHSAVLEALPQDLHETSETLEFLVRWPEQDLVHVHLLRLAHREDNCPRE